MELAPDQAASGLSDEPEKHELSSLGSFYALLSSLYVTQYIGIGFLFIGLNAILRTAGVDLDEIGMVSAMGVVWAVKFLWSPLIDRYGNKRFGHYRFWLVIFQSLMVFTVLAMAFVEPTADNFMTLMLLIGPFIAFSATQDIAADALVVMLIPRDQIGVANGLQVGASYLGNVIGGGMVVVLYDNFGWAVAMFAIAAMTMVSLFFILTNTDAPYASPNPTGKLSSTYKEMFSLVKSKMVGSWAFVVMPMTYIGVTGAYMLLSPALVDHGWSLSKIGFVLSVAGGIFGALGAIFSGVFVKKFGLMKPMLVANGSSIIAVGLMLPFFAGNSSETMIYLSVMVYSAASASASAVGYTISMKYCRDKAPGSDFTFLTCLAMLFSFIAGSLMLVLAEYVGYFYTATLSMAILVVGTVIMARHIRCYHSAHNSSSSGSPVAIASRI